MAYLALYRKYRPKSFEDMVGQNDIINILKNEVITKKTTHAYLFSGPRGTGKTTTAKILARLVNCENLIDGVPCETCDSCKNFLDSADLIEIDAASNNGVDEIRNIRDNVSLVPSNYKYKVYIIDEVHMLTTQAFNALLKTLEEPPTHVIFILATTEFYKIPSTIVSRCQRFFFNNLSLDDIVYNLKKICDLENLNISLDVLFEIARYSDGCCRDAVNLLDQVSSCSNGEVKIADVANITGMLSYIEMYDYLKSIFLNDTSKFIELSEKINQKCTNFCLVVERLLSMIKNIVILKNKVNISINDYESEILNSNLDFFNYDLLFSLINVLSDYLNKSKNSRYSYILFLTTLLKFRNDYVCVEDKNNDFQHNSSGDFSDLKVNECVNNDDNFININKDVIKNNFCFEKKDFEIRVNNCFSNASKDFLIKIKKIWDGLSDFAFDSKYSYIYGLFKDCVPRAASSCYCIISVSNDSLVNRLNSNVKELDMFIAENFDVKIYFVVVSDEYWNSLKSDYVNKLKKGINYSFIEYKLYFDDGVKLVSNDEKKEIGKKSIENDIDMLKNVIGNDIIIDV